MFQHTGQELADNLKVCMTAALKNYHEVNGRLPERIIVYRDGVGDGQASITLSILRKIVAINIIIIDGYLECKFSP